MFGSPVRRPSMLLIYAVTVTGVTVNTLVSPSIPDILRGFGASEDLAGVVLAAATGPGIVLAPVIGILADRYGRREVLSVCLLIFGVAGGLIVAAPNLWVLVVLRFFQGVGSAGLINLAVVLIGDFWDGTERSARIGRNAAVLTVAVAIFPVAGGGLTEAFGFRAPFFLYPVSLLTAVAVWRGIPSTPTSDSSVRDQLRAVLPVLRSRAIVGTLAAGLISFMIIFGLILTVLPLYAEARFGLEAGARGVLIALPSISSSIASVSNGWIQRRWGRRRPLAVAAALFAASLAGIGFSPLLVLMGASVFVFGFGQGVLIPTLQDVAASTGPDTSRGTVVAAWVSAIRTGQTSGPLVAAPLFSAAGVAVTFGAGAAMSAVLALVFLAGPKTGSGPQRPGPHAGAEV